MTVLQKAGVSSFFAAIKQVDQNLKLVTKPALAVLEAFVVKEYLQNRQPF